MSISMEPKANFHRDYLHSKLITVFRGLAALEVFLGHMRNQFFPDYKIVAHPTLLFKALVFSTGYGPQAVMIFFIMSGWLVGGNLWNRLGEKSAFTDYFIDRFTRLWVVMIPTMLFSLAAGLFLIHGLGITTLIDGNDLSSTLFLQNLFGLQHAPVVHDYGGNYSLWSLANETWYYIMFPLLLMPWLVNFRGLSRIAAVIAVVAIGCLFPFKLVLYILIWLTGVLFSRVKPNLKFWQFALACFAFVASSLIIRWYRWDGNFWPDFTLGLLFAFCLASTKIKNVARPRIMGPAEMLSNMSFSLYTMHVPLMLLLVGVTGRTGKVLDQSAGGDWLKFAVYLAIVFIGAHVFYRLFEARTYAVRRFVKARIHSPSAKLPKSAN